ncbi:histidine kinase [Microbacterium sp. 2FI]|uniref:histidine kinase n=1 Tax=Microbacterium sp. 2FI TaxID=2502193 RepID=UPI0010F7DCDB|nr:histidine kinase [Microbacterium sp. 2FI]
MRTSASGYAAAVVVALEGVGIAALVVWQILAMVAGDTGSLASSIALVVLTAVGAVAVLAFAVAIWRDRSWGRSGGIVTQVLILAVALGAATGAYADPLSGLVLAAPAIVALVLLVLAVHAAGRAAKDAASA